MKFKAKPGFFFHVEGNMKRFSQSGTYETEDAAEIEILKKTEGVVSEEQKPKKPAKKEEKGVKNG